MDHSATTSAEAFLKLGTIKIVALGLVAFAVGTAGGVISAVPMAARVSQKVGAQADPTNFLLMHAMAPNVAGVIGTAVVAGVFMEKFGV